MGSYSSELPSKAYVPNVVIRFMGDYYSIRQPDSGLTVDADKNGTVTSLNLNPTQIDPFKATTAINTNSFKILDKAGVLSSKFASNPQIFQGELCEIWIGRVNVSMAFSEYYKCTDTYISKVSKQDAAYTFQSKEAKDKLSSGAFSLSQKLAVDILAATTVITLQDASLLPSSGLFKLNDEYISYTSIIGNNLQGCIRGEHGSTPTDHELGDSIYIAEVIQDNPITLLLQLLISSGGTGTYDVLSDGAGLDESLIDVTEFEDIRDNYYSTITYKFILNNIESLKKFIEDEILFPNGLRLRSNNNSKIGLAVLNKPILNIDAPTIDHDEMTKSPQYSVDDTKITNRISIEWNYDDKTNKYLNISLYTDTDSITQFGETKILALKFKGIKESLSGQAIVDEIAASFFRRFSFPKPMISTSTHMSSSEWLLGEKPELQSVHIPNSDGELNFADSVEVVQRAINQDTGDVKFQLSFTEFTGIRLCFLAPSDTVTVVNSQSSIDVGAGRGDNYRTGWVMRLYNNTTRDYEDVQENIINTISGDTITFTNNWTTTLTTSHRIMFADYNSVTVQQKKFCFMSNLSNNFSDGKPPYQIVF